MSIAIQYFSMIWFAVKKFRITEMDLPNSFLLFSTKNKLNVCLSIASSSRAQSFIHSFIIFTRVIFLCSLPCTCIVVCAYAWHMVLHPVGVLSSNCSSIR